MNWPIHHGKLVTGETAVESLKRDQLGLAFTNLGKRWRTTCGAEAPPIHRTTDPADVTCESCLHIMAEQVERSLDAELPCDACAGAGTIWEVHSSGTCSSCDGRGTVRVPRPQL